MQLPPTSGAGSAAHAGATKADPESDVSRALDARRLDPSGDAANVLPLQQAGSSQTRSIQLAAEADLQRAHFSNPEIQFLGGVKPDDMHWWDEILIKPHGLSPKELRDSLLRDARQYMKLSNVVTTCLISRARGQKCVTVTIKLYGDNPEVVECRMKLDLDFKDRELTIQWFRINDGGKGMGTALSSNIEGLARNLGYSAVSVSAEKEAGPYFWPRRGYVPTQYDWIEGIADEIRDWLGKLAAASMISAGVQAEVEQILGDKDPQAITRIAALREPMIASSRNPEMLIPLGRALLAESGITYDASLRL